MSSQETLGRRKSSVCAPRVLGQLFVLLQYQTPAQRVKVMVRKAENLTKLTRIPGAAGKHRPPVSRGWANNRNIICGQWRNNYQLLVFVLQFLDTMRLRNKLKHNTYNIISFNLLQQANYCIITYLADLLGPTSCSVGNSFMLLRVTRLMGEKPDWLVL